MSRVDNVSNPLGDAGVSLNFEKCKLFSKSIAYLGLIIRPGRLEICHAHTASISYAELITTVTAPQAFSGVANVYRRFRPRFSKIAAPLYNLLKFLPKIRERQEVRTRGCCRGSRLACFRGNFWWNLLIAYTRTSQVGVWTFYGYRWF